jgi:surface polysaccharide O-acyltransferase-like enzyme
MTVILGSAGLFFLLTTIPPSRIERYITVNRVIRWVSQNTLPIYLIHIIVLVAFSNRIFGVFLNTPTHIPLLDVPIYTLLVFGVSAGAVYVLKQVPYLKKLVG